MTKRDKTSASTPDLATDKGLQINILSLEKVTARPKKRAHPENFLYAEFKSFKSQHMFQFFAPYKLARLYTGKSYWYIFYYYFNPVTKKYERFKEYFDINRIHDKKIKRVYGQEIIKFINHKLTLGFNPFKQIAQAQHGGTILQVLDSIYNDLMCSANDGMRKYYSTQLNRFKNFLLKKKMENIALAGVNLGIAENFAEWMIVEEKLAKKTVNVNLAYMSIFWKRAVKLHYAAADPFALVDRVKKDVRQEEDAVEDVYEPITFEELKQIVAAVKVCETPTFLVALMLIYYAWIRPKEVRQLRVGDINLASEYIKLKKGNTKNNKGAYVQIVPPLLTMLQAMELHKYKATDYLFSDNYLPGVKPLFRLKMWRLWTVITKRKLGIDKNMYALKHTGNIEYLLNNKGNIDLKWQQMQNRHSSSTMTDRYNRQLGAYFIDIECVKFREL